MCSRSEILPLLQAEENYLQVFPSVGFLMKQSEVTHVKYECTQNKCKKKCSFIQSELNNSFQL